jgi:hypothetical protein
MALTSGSFPAAPLAASTTLREAREGGAIGATSRRMARLKDKQLQSVKREKFRNRNVFPFPP